jgi:hypothetical protein
VNFSDTCAKIPSIISKENILKLKQMKRQLLYTFNGITVTYLNFLVICKIVLVKFSQNSANVHMFTMEL